MGQKAPSAIRCIKTREDRLFWVILIIASQKAPSAIRCIKTDPIMDVGALVAESEST